MLKLVLANALLPAVILFSLTVGSWAADSNPAVKNEDIYRGMIRSVLQDSCAENGEIKVMENSPVVDAILPTFDACLGRTENMSEVVPYTLSLGALNKTGGSGLNIGGTGFLDVPHGPGVVHCKTQYDSVEFTFPKNAPRVVKYTFIPMKKGKYQEHKADFDKVTEQLDNIKYRYKIEDGELRVESISRTLPPAKAGDRKTFVGTFSCDRFRHHLSRMNKSQIQSKAYESEEFRTCAAFWPETAKDDQKLRWAQCAARRSMAQYPVITDRTSGGPSQGDEGQK